MGGAAPPVAADPRAPRVQQHAVGGPARLAPPARPLVRQPEGPGPPQAAAAAARRRRPRQADRREQGKVVDSIGRK